MSDTVDSSVDTSDDAPKGKRGQTKKTEAQLREAFEASGVQGLLEVESTKSGNTRCTVRLVEGQSIRTLYGPVAGNTFCRALEGAVALGPHILSQDSAE
jgi:hypothetical protein